MHVPSDLSWRRNSDEGTASQQIEVIPHCVSFPLTLDKSGDYAGSCRMST